MNRQRKHSIDILFALALFCAFAASVLMVLMMGASSYHSVTDKMNADYQDRTGAGYIAEKIRHFDARGGIAAGQFDGNDALLLRQEIDGTEYITYIYYCDGYIRELLTENNSGMTAEAGEKVIEAAGFTVEQLDSGMIKITCAMPDGSSPYVLASPRSAQQPQDAQQKGEQS